MADKLNTTNPPENGTPTRRSFVKSALKSALAAPVALLPATALALANPATPDNADQEILALFEEWKAVKIKSDIAEKRANDATDQAEAEYRPEPFAKPRDVGIDADSLDECFSWYEAPKKGERKEYPELEAIVDKVLAKNAEMKGEWNSEKSAIDAKWNVKALHKISDDLISDVTAIDPRIFEMPAQTIIGVLIKLFIWQTTYDLDGEVYPSEILIADLGRFGVSL